MNAPQERAGGLSHVGRAVVSAVAVAVAAAVAVHLAMVVLYVAPSNVLNRQYSGEIRGYVDPEFAQNWKLFAPEPLHVNSSIEARVALRVAGGHRLTEWVDVTAADIEETRYNLVPSHTRNQLRKGWRSFLDTHDADNHATNLSGLLVERYLKRIALMRLSYRFAVDDVVRVQLRSRTKRVAEPAWSSRRSTGAVTYRVLPWWPVRSADFPEGSAR